MSLQKESDILVNFILNNNNNSIKLENITKLFFENIYKFLDKNYKEDLNSRDEFEISIERINKIILDDSYYFPENIIEYIKKKRNIINIRYRFFVGTREIILNYYLFDEDIIQKKLLKYSFLVKLIINFLSNFSERKCNKRLNIFIYLTEFKRELSKSGKILDVINVNGGYSNICVQDGRIVIYRKEEWLKF